MAHKKVTYSLPNLKKLVDSSNSCIFCFESCNRSLTVLAGHLDNIKHSVNDLLSAKVTTYDTVLKGIILGHKNIKVFNHVQLNDDGNFCLDYVADIFVFKPEEGDLLSGEVNKKSKDHIGVLVHSFFNVTIPRPRHDSECPRNWIGFDVNVGQSVTFEVVKVNFSGRLPFIKGKLIDARENNSEDRDSGIGGHESMEENVMKDRVESPVEPNEGSVKKKKKKKKKKKLSDLENGIEDDLKKEDSTDNKCDEELSSEDLLKVADEELNQYSHENKKKNKRKKKSSVTEDMKNEISPVNTPVEFTNISETLKKQKKSKKRKLSEQDKFSTAEPSCSWNSDEIMESVETPKKKKKKKHSNDSLCQD